MKNLLVFEIAATVLYSISVFFFGFGSTIMDFTLANQIGWALSCVACPLYVIFFYKKRLYSDVLEQSLYTPYNLIWLLSMFGFFTIPVLNSPALTSVGSTLLICVPIIVILSIGLRFLEKFVNRKWPGKFPEPASPWLDSITTAASLVATFLLLTMSPATWPLWIAVDVFAAYVYFKNKAYIVGASYILFTANAIYTFLFTIGILG